MQLTEFSLWGSDLVIEENFNINLSCNRLPVENSPSRNNFGIICLFLKGNADIEIDCVRYHLEKGMILSVFPMQVIRQIEASPDLKLMYFTNSNEILDRILFRFPPEFEMFLKEYPTFKFSGKIFLKNVALISMLDEKFKDRANICRNEIILSLIRCFYLEIYNNLHHELLKNPIKDTRGKVFMKKFISLLMQHYRESREVAFYANKLNITPKYLSIISEKVNGQKAKKVIDEYTITEIKLRLKATTQSLQEIAESLNFPDLSFFCKYFKKQTGMTPKHYRDK